MKIAVCIRQGNDGEIGPYDACALEEALKIPDAEVTLLSMGIPSTEGFLKNLTRLGAKKAVLLTDVAFAGSDTLATAYVLSLAIKKLSPDLVFCGKKTLLGDTGQVPPMLSELLDYGFIGNVMKISDVSDGITCETREGKTVQTPFPAVITVERINRLRLPSLRSKYGEVELLSAENLGADLHLCGLAGSPTRVLETKENSSGKRKCKMISFRELDEVVAAALQKGKAQTVSALSSKRLARVFCVGESALDYAKSVSDDVTVLPFESVDRLAEIIEQKKPNAVLFGSDAYGKHTSAVLAARMGLGLCADCTALDTDGQELFMIRPALSGSVIAKVKSNTSPALATVRTESTDIKDVLVCAGYGAKESLDQVTALARKYNAALAATRKSVDHDIMPYSYQVGLTGKTVAPPVYIAVGVSGAVHHIVGMSKAGTVIAVNPDKNAPVFEYADYGIVDKIENIVL